MTYTYDAANELLTENAGGTLTTYTYDENGNTLTTDAAGITTLTWGYENELLTVFEPDGTLVTMTYDGDLKRRKRAEGSGWTTYLWDREQVLMELNKTGTTTVRYTQAPRGYGDVISQRRSGVSTYWHFDAIGSMRFLTAADQSKAINYVYDAFGITRSVSGSTTNRFRYIGKLGYYLEPALGCYYLRRRYYVHWLGRFLSKDPLRRPGFGAYAYAGNAPTSRSDPSGLRAPSSRCANLLSQLSKAEQAVKATGCSNPPKECGDLNNSFFQWLYECTDTIGILPGGTFPPQWPHPPYGKPDPDYAGLPGYETWRRCHLSQSMPGKPVNPPVGPTYPPPDGGIVGPTFPPGKDKRWPYGGQGCPEDPPPCPPGGSAPRWEPERDPFKWPYFGELPVPRTPQTTGCPESRPPDDECLGTGRPAPR